MLNIYQIVDNSNLKEIDFYEAMQAYLAGKVIECRILNEQGAIVEWEKYHISEGMSTALEFNEIINGKWYIEL